MVSVSKETCMGTISTPYSFASSALTSEPVSANRMIFLIIYPLSCLIFKYFLGIYYMVLKTMSMVFIHFHIFPVKKKGAYLMICTFWDSVILLSVLLASVLCFSGEFPQRPLQGRRYGLTTSFPLSVLLYKAPVCPPDIHILQKF